MSRAKRPPRPMGPKALKGSGEAKRLAAVILEVLSGERDTTTASQDLGVSMARYYVLETRAIQGLIAALEPRKAGRTRTPERELESVKGANARLEHEVSRLQALVRASQRAMGLQAAPSKEKERRVAGKGGRRRRRTFRAMRLATALRTGQESIKPPAAKAEPKPEAKPPAPGA
ncbi:MAG TPA: hypothetical protein VFS09_11150 [Candidatus Eisenbacteria bacterium]|nr:hypothetical protein [Candidatus Eisenbacteria bacterium]